MGNSIFESLHIDEDEIRPILEKYNQLHISKLKLPEEFSSYKTINPNDVKYPFDPNVFFNVFEKIKMMRNYVLDYIYLFDHHGGEPYIYARKMDEKPISKKEEFFNRFSIQPPQMLLGQIQSAHARKPYLDHVVFENTFSGYFQFALFCFLIDRFYRHWHSCYNEMTFLLTREGLEKYLLSNMKALGEENVDRVINLNHQPLVELNGNDGKVRFTYFDPVGGGLNFLFVHITWPNIYCNYSVEVLIKGTPYLF